MKKLIAVAAAPRLALAPDVLAAVDGGAGEIQQQLGSPSDPDETPSLINQPPAKDLTAEEKRALYEQYKDSPVKPLWMMGYDPE